jgi:2-amino-4-hydroxy-6-hydroxymethyldihydropteridine diphosphokinase
MPEVFLSLGSNIEREVHVPAALSELARKFGPLAVSSLYESAPIGFDGPPFHNLVVRFATELPVEQVANILSGIEHRHGRLPDARKFSSRRLDIDLLLYGDLVRSDAKPFLPREDITRCAFVLEPLAEIAPDHRHPVSGERYADLWAGFDKPGLVQTRVGPATPLK